jgi:hypothetical protein
VDQGQQFADGAVGARTVAEVDQLVGYRLDSEALGEVAGSSSPALATA